ncbi:hypothetical protein [Candidatus Kuenenia stuttgartiensis]|uniref:hypothetical protein n=1 Tax=Kuenenia stuttgartiensis TaxID=174633 RepID=UPI00146CB7FC|nr:hypothetical protein [Candidatus Kuenenia stuttgartiensis]
MRTAEIQKLKDQIVAMEQLLEVYEQSVIVQTMKLQKEVSEHKEIGETLKDRRTVPADTYGCNSSPGIL